MLMGYALSVFYHQTAYPNWSPCIKPGAWVGLIWCLTFGALRYANPPYELSYLVPYFRRGIDVIRTDVQDIENGN